MCDYIVHTAAMSETTNLFDRLGGTRAMAERLDEPPSTVQSWKDAGRIPAKKQPAVLALEKDKAGEPITAEDVVFPLGRAADAPEDDEPLKAVA